MYIRTYVENILNLAHAAQGAATNAEQGEFERTNRRSSQCTNETTINIYMWMYDDERSFEQSFEQHIRRLLKRSLEQALERPFKRPNDRLTTLHAKPLFELLINKSIVRNILKWLSMMMYIIIDSHLMFDRVCGQFVSTGWWHLICTLYATWWKNIIFYFTRKNIFSQDWFWAWNEKGTYLSFGKIIVICLLRKPVIDSYEKSFMIRRKWRKKKRIILIV